MGATEIAATPGRGCSAAGFTDPRRLDRNFFLLLVALIWLWIVMGFVPESGCMWVRGGGRWRPCS